HTGPEPRRPRYAPARSAAPQRLRGREGDDPLDGGARDPLSAPEGACMSPRPLTAPLAALVAALALACGGGEREPTAPAPPPGPAAVSPPAGYPSPLASLRELVGRHPHDVALWEREPLAGRLRALLGERLPTFIANTEVQSPLLEEDGILYVTGNRPHRGGLDAAALVIDLRRDAVWVWLLVDGESEALLDRDVPVELPVDVRLVLEHA